MSAFVHVCWSHLVATLMNCLVYINTIYIYIKYYKIYIYVCTLVPLCFVCVHICFDRVEADRAWQHMEGPRNFL